MRQFSPDPNGPQIAVTWYEAAMFCNWLSGLDGIPQSEWVYPTRRGRHPARDAYAA
jgi:formylglycine-generating enzyme required for sulfatase activity